MLACTETVTFVHHVAGAAGDTYTCTTLHNASWFAKTVISTSADGAKPSNTYTVRVCGDADISANPGDYIVRGVISAVTKPADLAGIEHFRITTIGDNRRGCFRHWRFDGS